MNFKKFLEEALPNECVLNENSRSSDTVTFTFDHELLSESQLMELKSALRNVGRVVGAVGGAIAGGTVANKYGEKYGAAGRGASAAAGALAGGKAFGSAGAAIADKVLKNRIKRGNEKISKWQREGSTEEIKAKISNMKDKIAKWQKELND